MKTWSYTTINKIDSWTLFLTQEKSIKQETCYKSRPSVLGYPTRSTYTPHDNIRWTAKISHFLYEHTVFLRSNVFPLYHNLTHRVKYNRIQLVDEPQQLMETFSYQPKQDAKLNRSHQSTTNRKTSQLGVRFQNHLNCGLNPDQIDPNTNLVNVPSRRRKYNQISYIQL